MYLKEKFRQFKEKIDKKMEERRAYNKLIENPGHMKKRVAYA